MARSAPTRTTGRMARRAQQTQTANNSLWQPAAMCAVLALILALSVAFGRPADSAANASATPLPTPTAAETASATSETTTTPEPTPTPTLASQPDYDVDGEDAFSTAYRLYRDTIQNKYREDGKLSDSFGDWNVFREEGLTPQWFGLSATDLPLLQEKLLSGAPTAYTMSLISLIVGYEPAVAPTEDNTDSMAAWLEEYETRRAAAADDVAQRQVDGLGAFALPYVYDAINTGSGEDLFAQLPALTDGFEGLNQGDTAAWSQADWLVWLRNRAATWTAMKDALQEPIVLPWVKTP